jgi:hypothetical protein
MKTTEYASIHRFNEQVALSIGEGKTMYLTGDMAMQLAQTLTACARDICRTKFTSSNFRTTAVHESFVKWTDCKMGNWTSEASALGLRPGEVPRSTMPLPGLKPFDVQVVWKEERNGENEIVAWHAHYSDSEVMQVYTIYND